MKNSIQRLLLISLLMFSYNVAAERLEVGSKTPDFSFQTLISSYRIMRANKRCIWFFGQPGVQLANRKSLNLKHYIISLKTK